MVKATTASVLRPRYYYQYIYLAWCRLFVDCFGLFRMIKTVQKNEKANFTAIVYIYKGRHIFYNAAVRDTHYI